MNAFTKPTISISRARACYSGPSLNLEPHKNAAATIAISCASPFKLHIKNTVMEKSVALIPPETLHELVSEGPMVFLYLDALSDDHAALSEGSLERSLASVDILGAEADTLCRQLGIPARRVEDQQIAFVVKAIEAEPQHFELVEQAAKLAGLSVSHFQHRFRQQMGLPFNRYRTWRRMASAMMELSKGTNLTQASHYAGFASSAHFSNSFKKMFGIAPSMLKRIGAETYSPALLSACQQAAQTSIQLNNGTFL